MTIPSPPARFFDLRSTFRGALLETIALAETELLLFDPNYLDWPGNAVELEAALSKFLREGRRPKLSMVIDQNERLVRDYPRLADVLRTYAHCAECRQLPERYATLDETMVIADATSALRRPLASSFRGVMRVLDPDYASGQRERFMELWEASTDRFSPTSLGL